MRVVEKNQKSFEKLLTFYENSGIIPKKEAKGFYNKQNFRSHHTTQGAYGKYIVPPKKGGICVRTEILCMHFLFLEVQNH